jgi:hypothetical protein
VHDIAESINKQNKIETTTSDYKLNINDKVRPIESKKTSYDASPYYCMIKDISSKSIIISTVDGSFKTII